MLLAGLRLVCVFACVCFAARRSRHRRCRRGRSQLVCLLKRSQTPVTARRRRRNDAETARRRRSGDAAATRRRRGGRALVGGDDQRDRDAVDEPALDVDVRRACRAMSRRRRLRPQPISRRLGDATGDVAPPICKTQHATGEMRRVSCKMQHATGEMRRVSCKTQHASATDGRAVAARRTRERTATIKRANKQTTNQPSKQQARRIVGKRFASGNDRLMMADGTCNRTATKGGCGYAQLVRRSGALEGVLTGTHGVLMGTHGVLTELVLPPRAQLLWQFRPARTQLLRTSSREYP